MKRRVKIILIQTVVLCVMTVILCACQRINEVADENVKQEVGEICFEENEVPNMVQNQENPSETNSDNNAQTSNTEDIGRTDNKSQLGENGGEIISSAPDLEGSIKDIQEKQFTVVEAITEKSDNGGDIMIGPGNGDDSEFNKVAVTYDGNTVFMIKNVYDGGAGFETESGMVSDLVVGQLVEVWGTYTSDGLQATQICIVNVVSD